MDEPPPRWNESALLDWIKQRARRGINQARIQRKYMPLRAFSSVEQTTLLTLIEIEKEIDTHIQAESV